MKNRNQFSDILHHSRLARANGIWRLTGIFYFYALISTFPLGEALALPHTLIICTYTLKIFTYHMYIFKHIQLKISGWYCQFKKFDELGRFNAFDVH